MKEMLGFEVVAYSVNGSESINDASFIVLGNSEDDIGEIIHEEIEKRFFPNNFYVKSLNKVQYVFFTVKKNMPEVGMETIEYQSIDCKHVVDVVISPIIVLNFMKE